MIKVEEAWLRLIQVVSVNSSVKGRITDGIYTLQSKSTQPDLPSFSALISNSGAENKLKRSEQLPRLGLYYLLTND